MGPGLSFINLGRSSAVEVFDTLSRTPVIDPSSEKGKKIEGDGLQGKITFKDLFFFYPNSPNRPIFYNFNLTIEPGQSVALVGPSGSGKSTIARFLLRFYDPNQGEILIDDKYPLTALNVSWWRSQIAYVAQEPVIFPGTIRENIAMGLYACGLQPTDEEVENAAKMACAHDFILNLPNGYDTHYGGTSVQLSGGERYDLLFLCTDDVHYMCSMQSLLLCIQRSNAKNLYRSSTNSRPQNSSVSDIMSSALSNV